MNAGAMIAIHAAAAAAKAKSDALDAFRLKGATAPDRACALYDLGLSADNTALRDLFASGVLRGVDARGRELIAGELSGAGDRFYLDEVAFVAQRDGTSRTARSKQLIGIAIGAGLLLFGLVLFLLNVRPN
jgi:hypothetical protein